LKEPALNDDAFLADVETVRLRHEPDQLDCWWLGQSGFLVHYKRTWLLIDPYLSDSLTKKYATTDKPHDRLTHRVIDPAKLNFVTLVSSSHSHTDHLDADTLGPLFRNAATAPAFIVPKANIELAQQRSAAPAEVIEPFDAGDTRTVRGVEITAVPAAHNTLERDAAGHHLYLGYVFKLGPWTIYHSGDTKLYEGMAQRLRPFRPDMALLPINGDRPERRVAGNLDGAEAAQLAKNIGAGLVIPCHYDLFAFNTADPDDLFMPACRRIGQAGRILDQGERLTLHRPPPRQNDAR
jgi:L-ascorbate metabolism protein UlaG (beta-lactamase superfamily)